MKQVGGDINPARYGGSFFQVSGDDVEVLILQPVVEYVGEKEAADLAHPYWVKTVTVSREDVAKLVVEKGWRSFTGADERDIPDPLTAELSVVAAIAAEDEGYGHLDWTEEGNLAGEAIHKRYCLVDFQGTSIADDLREEDQEHATRREEEPA